MGKWQEELQYLASKIELAFDLGRLKLKQNFGLLDKLSIQPYRGFGNQNYLYAKGRVLENEGLEIPEEDAGLWENLKTIYYRYESDEIPDAPIEYQWGDLTDVVRTNEEGYFEIELPKPGKLTGWQKIQYRLLQQDQTDQATVATEGEVLLPAANSTYGLISDLDDTVIVSQATNFFEKSRILLLNNERSRKPFAGVAAFYQALHQGADLQQNNPIFYVSSSSWNLYDMFENFCHFNGLPKGVILLEDVGLDRSKFYKMGHQSHKLSSIARVLTTYQELPFLLVGDSGQQDPEIYQQLVNQFPGRILSIYIRDVHPEENKQRDNKVKAIADQVHQQGVPMLLVGNSLEAAQHAAAQGWIPASALDKIRLEVKEDEASKDDMRSLLGLHRIFSQ